MRTLALSVVLVALLFMVCGQAMGDGLTAAQIGKLNGSSPIARSVGLGTKLDLALRNTPSSLSLYHYGATGVDTGPTADGALFGYFTPQALTKLYLSTHAYNTLNGTAETLVVVSNTGGTVYATETTDANNADIDDVTSIPANVTVEDALHIGNATKKFARADVTISTAGNWVGVVTWEYPTAQDTWAALAGVTDGTTAFSAGAGTVSVTFTQPTNWALTTVNSISGYWIRGRCSTDTSGGGELLTKVYTVVADADVTWTDDTTDANSAGASDTALLPLYPTINDAAYIGKTAKYHAIKATIGQAMTVGAGVITIEYSKASTWGTLTCSDLTTTWKAGTSTYFVNFLPPTDWALQTVNSTSAYWVRFRLSTEGVTAQPLGTRLWVNDFTNGLGLLAFGTGTVTRAQMTAGTAAGTTADSKFILVNLTKGTWDDITWTKNTTIDSDTLALVVTASDKLVVAQYQEDTAAEPTNCNFLFETE